MSLEELLDLMSTLLWFNGQWHARAQGKTTYGIGSTPREAMEAALGLVPSIEDLFR